MSDRPFYLFFILFLYYRLIVYYNFIIYSTIVYNINIGIFLYYIILLIIMKSVTVIDPDFPRGPKQ